MRGRPVNLQALLLLVCGLVVLVAGVAWFSIGAAMILAGVLLVCCAVGSLDVREREKSS